MFEYKSKLSSSKSWGSAGPPCAFLRRRKTKNVRKRGAAIHPALSGGEGSDVLCPLPDGMSLEQDLVWYSNALELVQTRVSGCLSVIQSKDANLDRVLSTHNLPQLYVLYQRSSCHLRPNSTLILVYIHPSCMYKNLPLFAHRLQQFYVLYQHSSYHLPSYFTPIDIVKAAILLYCSYCTPNCTPLRAGSFNITLSDFVFVIFTRSGLCSESCFVNSDHSKLKSPQAMYLVFGKMYRHAEAVWCQVVTLWNAAPEAIWMAGTQAAMFYVMKDEPEPSQASLKPYPVAY
ncbi:hypothetical protein J6590_051261 [Homalodisca vitripennis]|nr:hypothetical protein J6590_051261 [Homalodisca vitripennis]